MSKLGEIKIANVKLNLKMNLVVFKNIYTLHILLVSHSANVCQSTSSTTQLPSSRHKPGEHHANLSSSIPSTSNCTSSAKSQSTRSENGVEKWHGIFFIIIAFPTYSGQTNLQCGKIGTGDPFGQPDNFQCRQLLQLLWQWQQLAQH